MEGYKIVFSTIRGREHNGEKIHQWFINKAKELDIDGVTIVNAMEGYGRNKNIHSAEFFELSDQPIEIIILATNEKSEKLFEAINDAQINIFYSKTKAEFGFTK